MSQQRTISGRRPALIWLSIFIVLILLVAVLIIVLFIYPNYQRQQQVEQHYQAGIAFQDAGDWDKAVDAFEKVVVIDATYKDTRTRLAEVKAKQQEQMATAQAKAAQATATAQARAEATAAAATAEALAQLEVTYQKCLGAINLGRWAEAQTACDQVFTVDPNYKDVQAKLAEIEAELAVLSVPTSTPTHTPILTPTATPTSSPHPTHTSSPTVTHTPLPTETPRPIPSPTPTKTPRPTHTPSPSPTPILDTKPGTILDVSQRWRVDGVELVLNLYKLEPDFIRPIFIFYNNTTNNLVVRFARDDRSQIVAKDNLGRTYAYDWYRWGDGDRIMEEVIESDSRIEFPVTLWPDGQFNLTDPQVSEIVITISFSKIEEARWRIPVHH